MTIVKMPQLGESVTEGTIIQWFKQPGDSVKFDEPLCEIETEKVTAELPSEFEGTMGRIIVPQGETVEVGAPLCEIQPAGAATGSNGNGSWSGGPMAIPPDEPPVELPTATSARANSRSGGTVVEAPPKAATVAATAREARTNPDDRARFYSPAVMRLASEHGVDLAAVAGSGVGGRITRKDIEAYIESPAAKELPAAPGAARPATTTRPAGVIIWTRYCPRLRRSPASSITLPSRPARWPTL